MDRLDYIQQNLREPKLSDHGTRIGQSEPNSICRRLSSLASSMTSCSKGHSWLRTPEAQKELTKFNGKTVAIFEDEIVASAESENEAAEMAIKNGYPSRSLIVIPLTDSMYTF